ncbi:hypothetical protein TrRE_jg9162, partial [Triparma retinervis]
MRSVQGVGSDMQGDLGSGTGKVNNQRGTGSLLKALEGRRPATGTMNLGDLLSSGSEISEVLLDDSGSNKQGHEGHDDEEPATAERGETGAKADRKGVYMDMTMRGKARLSEVQAGLSKGFATTRNGFMKIGPNETVGRKKGGSKAERLFEKRRTEKSKKKTLSNTPSSRLLFSSTYSRLKAPVTTPDVPPASSDMLRQPALISRVPEPKDMIENAMFNLGLSSTGSDKDNLEMWEEEKLQRERDEEGSEMSSIEGEMEGREDKSKK